MSALRQDEVMPTKERTYDLGSQRARAIVVDLGNEIRRARLEHGLSQTVVARVARTSRAQVSRIERAGVPSVSILQLARLLAAVGLELSARAYPGPQPVRDAAHLALIQRLRVRVGPGVAWRFEVPVAGSGDQRAWDAVLLVGAAEIAVEVETRLRDVQSVLRRISLKKRDDGGLSGVILLMSNTRHNRSAVRDHGDALRAEFPLSPDTMLHALAEGRNPEGSGIVLL
jgi:transcriptional regulator with XRE-family HTH domain